MSKKRRKSVTGGASREAPEGAGVDQTVVNWGRQVYRDFWGLSETRASRRRTREGWPTDSRPPTHNQSAPRRALDSDEITGLTLLQFLRKGKVSRRAIFALCLAGLFALYGSISLLRDFTGSASSGASQGGAYTTSDSGDAQQAGGGGGGGGCCGGQQQEIKGTAEVKGDYQEIKVQVQGGYDPNTIEVKKGIPLKITFARQSSSGCDQQLVFPDLNIYKTLPDDGAITLDIEIPDESGKTIQFTCGMGMLSGKIVVKDTI